jgi:DNA invertase Pin-like site-specific DNA recombinase
MPKIEGGQGAMGRQIGYARVSTDDLHGKAQKAALQAVPCDLLFFEQESGANRERPELARALKELRSGDTLVVARLERLGRSLIHLLQIMEDLEGRGIAFRSLAEGFDMRTDEGQLMMQQLGSFAEFERKRITARINSGIAAAKKRGVQFGNPGLKMRDKDTIKRIVLARDETHVTHLIDTMDAFIPTVLQLRPAKAWPEVAEAVSRATGATWTVERLVRSVRRLVREGMVDRKVLAKAPRPRRRRSEELAHLVQGLAFTNPGLSLRGIGGKLEAMKIRTPAGKPHWTAASVAHLLKKVPGASVL